MGPDIKFDCLHCAKIITQPAEMVGETIDCPWCGKPTKVTVRFSHRPISQSSSESPSQEPVIAVTRKTLIVTGAILSAIIAVVAITAGNHAAKTERKRLQEEQKAKNTAVEARQRADETQRTKAEAERRQEDLVNDQMAQKKIKAATVLAKEIKEAKATLAEIQSKLPKDNTSELSLVGEWKLIGHDFHYEFKKDGTFRFPNTEIYGVWSLDGKSVTMKWIKGGEWCPIRKYTMDGTSMFSGENSGVGKEVYMREPLPEASSEAKDETKRASFPNGTAEYNGHHYFVVGKAITWMDAKKHAEIESGHLVTLSDKEEMDFVTTILRQACKPYGLTDGLVWVGARYKNMRWLWDDNTDVNLSLWAPKKTNQTFDIPVALLNTVEGLQEAPGTGVVWYVIEWDY